MIIAIAWAALLSAEETASRPPAEKRAASEPSPPETAKVTAEDAPTVDPGRTEVEFNYTFGHAGRVFNSSGHVRDRGTLDEQLFTVKATRGLADGLDAAVSVVWSDLIEDGDDEFDDGVGNVVVNAKWRLFQDVDETVLLSWLPGFTAPIADGAHRKEFLQLQDYWSIDNLLALTLVGERFNLSVDGSYSLPLGSERDEDRGIVTTNFALGYQLTSWFQPEVELAYAHGFVDDDDDTDAMAATAGVILSLPRDTRIDLGVEQTFYGRNVELGTLVVANFSLTF